MIIEARTNNGTIGSYQNLIDLRNSGNYVDTNWQDEIFRNALNARTNLSVTGGNDRIKYNFSVGYQDEDGILLNSYFKKVTVKGGFEAKLNDWAKIGASFSPTYSNRRSQSPSGGNTEDHTGVMAEALTAAPIIPVFSLTATIHRFSSTIQNTVSTCSGVTLSPTFSRTTMTLTAYVQSTMLMWN